MDYLVFGRLLLAGRGLLIRQVWDASRERKTSHGADEAQRVVGGHANVARFGQGSDPFGVGHLAGHVGAYVLDGTPGFISISNSWMEWSRSPMGIEMRLATRPWRRSCPAGPGLHRTSGDTALSSHG